MTLTRIPRSRSSLESVLAMLTTAALVAPYTEVLAMPRWALIDPLSTIAEPFDISGIAFWTVKKTPFMLISTLIKDLFGDLFEGHKFRNARVNEHGVNTPETFFD